jgi:hypothetical protein
MTVKVHEVATDGYPDMDKLVGRVAFLFDGCIVSGWPLFRAKLEAQGSSARGVRDGDWEADSDVGHPGTFGGVTHWVEFPKPLHSFTKRGGSL